MQLHLRSKRFYLEGYREGLEGLPLSWTIPLSKRQQANYERGLKHGEEDAEKIRKGRSFTSQLEVE